MLTVKHQYADGGERSCEACEVRHAVNTVLIDHPKSNGGISEQFELAAGDTLYVMNELGSTIARYFGPKKSSAD
ncbi:Uncharacterised protein [Serratia liquefaciens]|jgi:hypothetical protein|uniref:hypothetical protein n=1 Tax=Serratia liquefaciens TaxID=614 RepID=UPI00217CA7CB|nr:hypothetical protein [Serratia liquefaciens]CAI1698988.1 Uncharacterised protein [Serratia liquefaciens]HDS8357461.1 hypothetical protein [Serratia liquefaciens]